MIMKKVAVSSLMRKSDIIKVLKKNNFEIVEKNPNFAISYGGDGSVLYTQRKYSAPILALKKSQICHKCEIFPNRLVYALEKIKNGKFKIVKEMKLEAKTKGKKLSGLNEIQLHTSFPTKAIRFSLQVGKRKFNNLVGDGVIVATPFGSTAYYKSTDGRPFKKGIGISFNNLYGKKIKSFIVPENSKIILEIIRGPGLILADNDKNSIKIFDGDKILIRKSKNVAKFIQV